MHIIILRYTAAPASLAAYSDAHRTYFATMLRNGKYLFGGRLQDGSGGMVITRSATEEEIKHWIWEDPYHQQRLATYKIVMWDPAIRASNADIEASIFALPPVSPV